MQQVTAFSRPQTVPAIPTTVPKKNPWILSSWRDLILYVGTPLLLVPMFALAQARWSAQDIYVFVAAFGAMGHHLPGMIRAYGDRALFERFRWRFIFAPIFLVGTCTAFYWWDLKGIILVVFFWGVWHGMMQTYGFCRIYDAKMGSFAALSRRLDFATCAIWFAAGVLLSSNRMADTLEAYYSSGGPFIPPMGLHLVQQIVLVAAVAVSVLFLVNFAWMWARGKRSNPVKVALLGTSIGFWWYCNNSVSNILAGIALFEVFHDTQYLSLVWIYNRNRVEKDSSIGGFMRFVFRRSGSLMGLYIGLVFAYGSLGYFNSRLEIETIKRVLTGIVAASGLLHFYYDGFIWKVREKSTRESLGLSGGAATTSSNQFLPSWLLHGLKWVAIFVVPLTLLCMGQIRGRAPEDQRGAWLVADLPFGGLQHLKYGMALQASGRADDAIREYNVALGFDPSNAKTHFNLGSILITRDKVDDAATHFAEAIRLDPEAGDYHYDYAYALERLGRDAEAREHYEAAVKFKPKSATYRHAYGGYLARTHHLDEGIAELRAALRIKPDFADAHFDLAGVLWSKGQLDEAKTHYLETIRLDPKRAAGYNSLGDVCFQQGQMSQAILNYQEALRLDPHLKDAQEHLQLAQATEQRFQSRFSK
jgi:tetratricopeptide (TPR) repeat protein